jgi:hypothetical protein
MDESDEKLDLRAKHQETTRDELVLKRERM